MAEEKQSRLGTYVSTTTAGETVRALETLTKLKIAEESTAKRRDRLFGYPRYLHILSEGTEPLRTDPGKSQARRSQSFCLIRRRNSSRIAVTASSFLLYYTLM